MEESNREKQVRIFLVEVFSSHVTSAFASNIKNAVFSNK